MTAHAPTADAHAHEHHELGFVRTYIFSLDHKMIAKQFLFMSLFMMIIGGGLALMMRWQLAYPETQIPGTRWIPEPLMYDGFMPPEFYNAAVTMHATIMVFFVVMPLLVGCFGNFLIPLMIGAGDMAFPLLNCLSFWVAVPAGLMMVGSFWVEGGAAAAGWTGYAPLSTVPTYSGVDMGQNLWALSLIVLGASSLMGAVNYITTVINMRAPGMTWFRLPLVIWALFITAVLLLLALPVLTAGLGMMLFDRMAGTSFFLPEGGGEPLLWQHVFWFFGHPEVYIMILPAMGIASEIMPVFARKPVFGYHAMAFSIIAIGFLSWIVWGHHMFQSGMNFTLGTSFMITTMVIAVPSAIKTFNWLGTIWGGNIHYKVPMLWALGFIATFVIGGLSGIYMANSPVDIFIHDTYFIVAHIHYVLFGGAIYAMFGAVTFWFPKMFGRLMNPALGQIHFWGTFIFYNLGFFPMHIIGVGGHMRRIYNPTQYEFLAPMQSWNEFISENIFIMGAFQIVFAVNLFYSLWFGKKADRNPWQSNTLEWECPSPPGHGNFETPVTVYRGPYEYSSPEVEEDYLPQARNLGGATGGAH